MNEQGTGTEAAGVPGIGTPLPGHARGEDNPEAPEKPARKIMTRARNKIEEERDTARMLCEAANKGNNTDLAERYAHIGEVLEWVLDRNLKGKPTQVAHIAHITQELS